MFKFVICAFFAVTAAKPDVLLTSPLAPLTTTYISPATTTITKQATGFISQGPLVYSTPLGYAHYIKKRGIPLTYYVPKEYITKPGVTTYTSALPTYTTPILHAATLPIATTHFIKKRSAPLLATSLIAPATYTTPLVTPTLTATAPLITSPLITPTPWLAQPITYATHLIKKRSAPVFSTYTAPSAVTYQSRLDLHQAPIIGAYGAPLAYSATIPAYTHII